MSTTSKLSNAADDLRTCWHLMRAAMFLCEAKPDDTVPTVTVISEAMGKVEAAERYLRHVMARRAARAGAPQAPLQAMMTAALLEEPLVRLGAQLDAAVAALRPLHARTFPAGGAGTDVDRAAYDAAEADLSGLRAAIATAPAVTLAGFAVKARALASIYGDEFSAEGMELGTGQDDALLWGILSGLAAVEVAA